jgi:hypothetical protein
MFLLQEGGAQKVSPLAPEVGGICTGNQLISLDPRLKFWLIKCEMMFSLRQKTSYSTVLYNVSFSNNL